MTRMNVHLDGVLAGHLEQLSGGALTFTYDAGYTSRRSPTPLSLSMPLSAQRHGNRVVSAWLEGLLPTTTWPCAKSGAAASRSLRATRSRFWAFGRDAAGAFQVLPLDVDPQTPRRRTGDVRHLSERRGAVYMLLALTLRDDGWEVGEGFGWLELGRGAEQVRPSTGWTTVRGVCRRPDHDHARSQTDGVGTRFADLHVNEFVCLRAAGLLGLRVAHVDLVD